MLSERQKVRCRDGKSMRGKERAREVSEREREERN